MSAWLDLYGPDQIGKNAGFEIPLWQWTHPSSGDVYQISRVISKLQAEAINQEFDVQWARHQFSNGILFRLDLIPHDTQERKALSVLGIRQVAFHSSASPFDQITEETPWRIEMFDRGRRFKGAYEDRPPVEPLELDPWVTFLFDYLGLDPRFVARSIRTRWQMPYVASFKQDWTGDNLWRHPYPLPAEPFEVLRDTYREGRSQENKDLLSWMRNLGVALGLWTSEPHKHMISMHDDWFEITVHWDMNPTPEVMEKYPDRLLFRAQRGSVSSSWFLSPLEAIESLGSLVHSSEDVETWIDHHVLDGAWEAIPFDLFEPYRLLGQEIPVLEETFFLLQFMKSREMEMPWDAAVRTYKRTMVRGLLT